MANQYYDGGRGGGRGGADAMDAGLVLYFAYRSLSTWRRSLNSRELWNK